MFNFPHLVASWQTQVFVFMTATFFFSPTVDSTKGMYLRAR